MNNLIVDYGARDYNERRWAFGENENIYLHFDEIHLFELWLTFADPTISLDAIRSVLESEGDLHPPTTSNKRLLTQLINESQKERFAFVAQYLDIRECMRTRQALREEYEWDETLEVLKAMQEDDDRECLGNGKGGK